MYIVFAYHLRHVHNLIVVQKGVGYNNIVEKIATQVMSVNVREKLNQTNTKYKEVIDEHYCVKVFKE